MIKHTCPHCGHILYVGEQFAGKRGTCKYCKQKFTVPAASPPHSDIGQTEKHAYGGYNDVPRPDTSASGEEASFNAQEDNSHIGQRHKRDIESGHKQRLNAEFLISKLTGLVPRRRQAIVMVAVVPLVLMLLVCGITGYRRYAENKVLQSISSVVRNCSLRTGNHLKSVVDHSSVTFEELSKGLETDISEIGKGLLFVQLSSTPSEKENARALEEYISSCQEFLRVQLLYYKRKLAFLAVAELARLHPTGMSNSDAIALSFTIAEREGEALIAGGNLIQAATTVHAKLAKVRGFFPEEDILDASLLDRYTEHILGDMSGFTDSTASLIRPERNESAKPARGESKPGVEATQVVAAYHVGDEISLTDRTLCVHSIAVYEDSNPFTVARLRGAGLVRVVADVSIYNKSAPRLSASSLSFSVSDKEGRDYKSTIDIYPNPPLSSRELRVGERARGWVCFDLPANIEGPVMRYSPNIFEGEHVDIAFP